jgi:hypothetical protein
MRPILVGTFFVLTSIEVALCEGVSSTEVERRPTSTFNQQWLEAVISIEVSDAGKDPEPVGTGFLVGTSRKHVLIVTAKHVIADPLASKSQRLGYRLNTAGTGSVVVWEDALVKQGLGEWYLSPTADVACRYVAWPNTARIVTIATDRFMGSASLMAGTPVLALGFPLGLRSTDHALPIARQGIVARADQAGIIADMFVFPGNSGGPVVYTPSFKPGKGLTSALEVEEKLIGVVSSFIPYREPAISPHTKRVRVMFEENSGLANVVPVDHLVQLIDSAAVKQKDATLP